MKKVIASPLAPKAVGPYSQAIAHDATLYISGQLPIDGATGKMAEGVELRYISHFYLQPLKSTDITSSCLTIRPRMRLIWVLSS